MEIEGELAEWFNAVVLKTTEPETVPGVQIPHSPPHNTNLDILIKIN